mmetsp:Transcript_35796/g.65692  ORF Transcript_35796/g.65692 Transcript_35796/m.65692 type:complete len:342 (-) Transcript_35796:289-1314(-)
MVSAPEIFSEDYYKVLGLPRGASEAEIGKAYKKLALKHHPDKNPDDKEAAEQRFKRISEAYSVLSDADKKKDYDQFGKAGLSGNGGGAGAPHFGGTSGGFSNEDADRLFRMFFGGHGMNMAGGAPNLNSFRFTSRGSPTNSGFHPGLVGGHDPFGGLDMNDLLSGNGFMSRSHSVRRGKQAPYTIPAGKEVVVHGLSNAAHHNGRSGKVIRFDEQRMRYEVSTEHEVLALRPQNITQKLEVEIIGLKQKPELNGAAAEIFDYQDDTDRYTVFVKHPRQAIALQPDHCLFKEGTVVTLRNLSNARYNGQMGYIIATDRAAGRYRVMCKSGDEVAVKFGKVLC